VDHWQFYRNPANMHAFKFLDRECKSKQTSHALENSDQIVTQLLHPAGEFPAIAVSYHPDWPPLCWGKQSIQGENQWPHPLA
jgi:hypothetical protein